MSLRARPRRRPARTAVLAVALLLTPAGAAAACPPPPARASGDQAAPDRPPTETARPQTARPEAEQPTGQDADAQVARLLARARDLHATARRQAASLPEALAAVEAATADSALALTAYRAAAETRQAAAVELDRQELALARAEDEVTRQREETTRWVRTRYVDGAVLTEAPALSTLLTGGSTDDVLTRRVWLERTLAHRAEAATRLRATLAHAAAAASAARQASADADAAATRAQRAGQARDEILATQRARLTDLDQALAATTRDARTTETEAARIATESLDAARQAADLLTPGSGSSGNTLTGPVGDCRGGDVSRYGNGRIPASALCPVTGAPGELLRADAAYAFDRLTTAYAARFGHGLCVTDAYRSYDDQVRVRAERPGYAAVPGTSNHGWGTATDLCGGVDRFGTPEHTWMRRNAPLFGWFHPAWAHADGSTPEPWHWEFSG